MKNTIDFLKDFGGHPYIYRFRGNSKRTISELEEGYVYFANRNELNDPFDSNPGMVSVTKDAGELEQFYNFMAGTFPNELKKTDFLNIYSPDTLRDFMVEKLEFYILHYGIVCFSMHLCNYPLWANYADNHSGLCLQFNIEKDKRLFRDGDLRPIKYVSEPNRFTFNPHPNWDTLTKLFFQKTSDWDYEKEIRLVKVFTGRHYFHKTALEKIILGYRCQPEFIEKVKEIVKANYPETHLFKMMEPKEFNKISLIPI